MWYASLDSPTPRSSTAFASRLPARRSSSEKAAASPIEMPSRVDVERPARAAGQQAERVEAVQRGQAQRVDAADDGRIDQAGLQHAPRRGEHLGAGRAGRRDRHGRPFQPEMVAHEVGHRIRVVRGGVIEVSRQGAADRIAAPVGQLGLQDARGAGAQENADAPAPDPRDGRDPRPVRNRPGAGRVAPGGCCGSRRRANRRAAPRRRPLPPNPSRCPARRHRNRTAASRCAARATTPGSGPVHGRCSSSW